MTGEKKSLPSANGQKAVFSDLLSVDVTSAIISTGGLVVDEWLVLWPSILRVPGWRKLAKVYEQIAMEIHYFLNTEFEALFSKF